MAPTDRQAAIVAATIPLLRTRGWLVTTREIAAAADVAEGTIFSVFTDKNELLTAALSEAVDPKPTVEALAAIDDTLALEERLVAAVDVLQERMRSTWELASLFRLEEVRLQQVATVSGDFLLPPVVALLESARDELAVSPEAAARVLVALATAGSNPMFLSTPLTRPEVVTVVLDGLRKTRASAPPPNGSRKTAHCAS